MLVLGSVHAFSMFLGSIEEEFATTRSNASLTYSITLAVLTIHVLIGDRIFRRISPGMLILVVTLISTTGVLIAGYSSHLYMVWIGYGVMFGAANGLGYSFALQYSAQAIPAFRGAAMGLVTAAYGLGAAVAPLPFELLLDVYGFRGGMTGLAFALASTGLCVAFLFARSGHRLLIEKDSRSDYGKCSQRVTLRLWVSYGTAVAAGLMVIGHATGIAHSGGLPDEWIFIAPTVIAVGNVVGSYFGGYLVDVWGARRLLYMVSVSSTLSLAIMWGHLSPLTVLLGLAIVGLTYGATIAAFPAAIANLFGAVRGIRIYGLVFTAWGVAGLLAPWVAGVLFERSNNYTSALLLATVLGSVSILSIFWFPNENEITHNDSCS